MSLFICQNPACKCVENTNLVSKNVYTNDGYPNMHLMDMQGMGDEIIYSGEEFLKHPQDILMLCSECNTGTWHGEFPKEKASEDSIALSKLSKYSAITPMDHPSGTIVKNKNSEWGKAEEYRLATPEEIEAYYQSRKRSRETMSKIAGLVGPDIFSRFFKTTTRKRDTQSPADKKRKMFKAELKRQIKFWKKQIPLQLSSKDRSDVEKKIFDLKERYEKL